MTNRVSSAVVGHVGGRPVAAWSVASDSLRFTALEYGARITRLAIRLPDERWRDVVLSLGNLEAYVADTASVGALVGRYANRIRDARFSLNGKPVRVEANEGDHHLHGGPAGFANRCWEAQALDSGIRFRLSDPAGTHGFPGDLVATVDMLVEDDALEFRYEAQSDADTVINLTHHGYFNIGDSGSIDDHCLQIDADRVVEIDADKLPTGQLATVDDTPFDLRQPVRLLDPLRAPELAATGGFDHCFVLEKRMKAAARLEVADLAMTVTTSEPGLQVYTGNYLPRPHAALCLETQHFPDSPNQPHFPSTLLLAGEGFHSVTRYAFENI